MLNACEAAAALSRLKTYMVSLIPNSVSITTRFNALFIAALICRGKDLLKWVEVQQPKRFYRW